MIFQKEEKQSLKKMSSVFETGATLTAIDENLNTGEVIKDDIVPLVKRFAGAISDNPQFTLSMLYDEYMETEGMAKYTNPVDSTKIARTAFSYLASFALGGPAGGLGLLAADTVVFYFDFYTNFFHHAAWITMRYSWSSRYAERIWEYLMG